jgi:hypothetical protein
VWLLIFGFAAEQPAKHTLNDFHMCSGFGLWIGGRRR